MKPSERIDGIYLEETTRDKCLFPNRERYIDYVIRAIVQYLDEEYEQIEKDFRDFLNVEIYLYLRDTTLTKDDIKERIKKGFEDLFTSDDDKENMEIEKPYISFIRCEDNIKNPNNYEISMDDW